ncbi:GMP synthase (glutamine-hydrolysing) [Pseudoxanthobacter soli DSM 19599]|uniref:GMP synthase (Glutamine-hydrolysing) n=1 Tax=Pseudoxanthobacter soli DSM 19599 TaxID=1123029 RepID=A0A1M7Z7E8_9HYPH|nr:gamma-glutamyl-gamma-aminobutyrate hydrolase family protein [Pseudoxanthobacter soli]SHO60722.1 GMP synthase (glutamine-hydrolysing) [Pseudoxanthobacter soli DSM 19599]
MKPLLILECEVVSETAPTFFACCGEVGPLIGAAAGFEAEGTVIVRIGKGEAPPPVEEIGGLVISGSASMVADPDPWIATAADYCRRAIAAEVPTLGICFGHQLIAHALGGVVAPIDGAPEYGTVEIERMATATSDALFSGLPERFLAQAAHFQSVLVPPAGSEVLAVNPTGIHGLRFAPTAWGVQFHPEFTAEGTRLTLDLVRDDLVAFGVDPDAQRAAIAPTPVAATVLTRFARIVRGETEAAPRKPEKTAAA